MEKLNLEDFTMYKFISGLKFSPKGKKLAFMLHQMDVEENKYLSNIHIYDLDKEKLIQLTSSNSVKSFIFKDENNLYFADRREEKDREREKKGEDFTSYYEISLQGGEAIKAFEIPLKASKIEIIDKDRFLLIGEYDHRKPRLEKLSEEEKEKALKELEEEKDYQVIDEIPFWYNGKGFTNKIRSRVYIYNLKDKKLKPITDAFTNAYAFKLNENKSKALIITNSYIDKMQIKDDLYLYDIEKDSLEKISHCDCFFFFKQKTAYEMPK